ncbi:MAG TPA: DUF2652 domain-containing protein [Ignavibacteriaceae bacterium]|nr:DUF2652 domain-containing protein [Ignavibacteriaceae bacterium]
MENKGLLFIPDISGFTRFINEVEIDHSRLIIEELLEIIINSNSIGLEVSEVEGDAILFYKYGSEPDLKELYAQVEKMFKEFHKDLIAYDARRYCFCKACSTAVDLSLKIITHYGEFTGYKVRNFNKLLGKDVIVAHQLLKNNIDQHEYWLITDSLLSEDSPKGFKDWMKWNSSIKQTESGEIPFHYTQLSTLKEEITLQPAPSINLVNKTKLFSVFKEYETDLITLFHAAGDLNHRSKWLEGVKEVEVLNHYLPRVGMRCRFIMENGEEGIYSSSYSYSDNTIEFSETDEQDKVTVYNTLRQLANNRTSLRIDYYVKNEHKEEISNLGKKAKAKYLQSLENLSAVIKEIKLPIQDFQSMINKG